jgi:hypothetical protein
MYTYLNSLWTTSRVQGQAFVWNLKLTDTSTPFFKWFESPTNVAQFVINGGATATLLNIGNDVLIQANRAGQVTVFNASKINSDLQVWGQGGTEPVAWVDASMQRFAVGYDHYLPLYTATNPNIYFNETNKDMDFFYRGTTDNELIHGNAALQSVGFGGDGESGIKVKVWGDQRITGSLKTAGVTNDDGLGWGTYNPTGSNTVNLTSYNIITPWTWMRVGDNVAVAGQIAIRLASTSGVGSVSITTPIATTFTVSWDANGTGSTITPVGIANVGADVPNNKVIISVDPAVGTGNNTYKVHFMFRVK